MRGHGLGSATLDDVLLALLNGLKAVTSLGKPVPAATCIIMQCLMTDFALHCIDCTQGIAQSAKTQQLTKLQMHALVNANLNRPSGEEYVKPSAVTDRCV